MTYTPTATRVADALHEVAETLAVWLASGEFETVSEHVRADLAMLPDALRMIGREMAQ